MTFQLPDLPYAKDALEPVIDAATMELHHGKHHNGYTTKLNDALQGTSLEGKSIEEVLANLKELPQDKQMAVRNNGGGFFNHSLFWLVMAPESDASKADPDGALKEGLDAAFGSFEKFKEAFEGKATTQFGSGWAWLCVGSDGKLFVTSTPNQDNTLMDSVAVVQDGTPILGLDVWEHAYYLKYQNRRPDYVKAWWSIVNWSRVSKNLELAKAGKSVLEA